MAPGQRPGAGRVLRLARAAWRYSDGMHLDVLDPTHASAGVRNGLVLMGGGARTAYQVGVLQGLGQLLAQAGHTAFPFQVLLGTSAGALNAVFLASRSRHGLQAFDDLAAFWSDLRSPQVYRLPETPLARWSRWATALGLVLSTRQQGAALDNLALAHTLHRAIALPEIDAALAQGALEAVAVTASSYSSGCHWTFCQTRDGQPLQWSRAGRRAEQQALTIEHLMASSAIPFLFPATPLWVDGRMEHFGDGSMRQVSPLAPAVHLGARRILAIGAGQPRREGEVGPSPSLGAIAGHAMASIFHDTLASDVEQMERVNRALATVPATLQAHLPFHPVEVLAISPSQSLDLLAQHHVRTLPLPVVRVLDGLGALHGGGVALASYLLFEPGFVQALMALGRQDVQARAPALRAFWGLQAGAAVQPTVP